MQFSESWKPYLLEPDNVEKLRHLLVTIHPGHLARFYKLSFENPHDPKAMMLLSVSLSKTRAEDIIEGIEILCESYSKFVETVVDFWLRTIFGEQEDILGIDQESPHFHMVVAALSARSPSAEAPSWSYVETMAARLLSEETGRHQEASLLATIEQLKKDNEKLERKVLREEQDHKNLHKRYRKLETKYGRLEQRYAQSRTETAKFQGRLKLSEDELGQSKKIFKVALKEAHKQEALLQARLEQSQKEVAAGAGLKTELKELKIEVTRRKNEEESEYINLAAPSSQDKISLENYEAFLGKLQTMMSQVEVINSKGYMRHYALFLRRYNHILQKLRSEQHGHKESNWLKAELGAINVVLSLALETELIQTSSQLPHDEAFEKALIVDYGLLGEEASKRFRTLLDLYEDYRFGTSSEALLEKTNLALLEAVPEGLLLLGLESFLDDCLNLPLRRYLNLSSFKHESVIMALGRNIREASAA